MSKRKKDLHREIEELHARVRALEELNATLGDRVCELEAERRAMTESVKSG